MHDSQGSGPGFECDTGNGQAGDDIAGLGLRRALLDPLLDFDETARSRRRPDFLEVSPENWLDLGGAGGRKFRALAERYRLRAHGLSLSVGGPAPLDMRHLRALKTFLDTHGIVDFSEHLSWCSDTQGQLYDLMPMPFTGEAVEHVAKRVRRVQDVLERRIALENISTYLSLTGDMTESEFVLAVLEAADCDLLLDVNNLHVNSVNHGYDARAWIDALPADRIGWLHVAGHEAEAPDLLVDTHGTEVADPVWDLLAYACDRIGPRPVVLERDFDIPPLPRLLDELDQIRRLTAATSEAGGG